MASSVWLKNSDGAADSRDERYLREALLLAEEARQAGEVPVGAVIVAGDQIIGRGRNSVIALQDPTAHAEIVALRAAAAAMGNYRLTGAMLYVTLEPCPMCAGAIIQARIARLVFGARDLRFGGVRSKFQLADSPLLNHQAEIVEGVLGAACTRILADFFAARRGAAADRVQDPKDGR